MGAPSSIGTPHHVRPTGTDVARSRAFYTEVLGFDVTLETPPETTRAAWSRAPSRAGSC